MEWESRDRSTSSFLPSKAGTASGTEEFQSWDLQQQCFRCLTPQGIPELIGSPKNYISASASPVPALATEIQSHAPSCSFPLAQFFCKVELFQEELMEM